MKVGAVNFHSSFFLTCTHRFEVMFIKKKGIEMVLYVNACVRAKSRTNWLAGQLLDVLGEYTELDLKKENLRPLNQEILQLRSEMIEKSDYSSRMFNYAKQFAEASRIVIAAPYWDLSFPALLKTYVENIYVTGLVSKYAPDGQPIGLCRAENLYYVTTAGGPYDGRFSFDYIKEMAEVYFGIKHTHLIMAEMLDIEGADVDKILEEAASHIKKDINGGFSCHGF